MNGQAVWILTSGKMDANNEPENQFVTIITNPVSSSGLAVYPFANGTTLSFMSGAMILNGNEVFEEGSSATFVFEPSGNNPADNQNIGQANYTSQMVNNETSKSAKLFWNGNYTFNHIDIKELQGAKSKADLKQEIINYLIKDSPDKI